ncbi:MAG: hypothetical protein JRD02_03050, partial [Deltaproteobacteria bacterium]|nr:hypothetical protein [Deltaproteobacteria bacterium]
MADIKKLNPAHVAAIAKTVNTCPYFTLLSMELKLNYLAPVSAGRLIAKGRSVKVGKSICLG